MPDLTPEGESPMQPQRNSMQSQNKIVDAIADQMNKCLPSMPSISLCDTDFEFELNFCDVVLALQTKFSGNQSVFDRFFEIAADGSITVCAVINVSNCTFYSHVNVSKCKCTSSSPACYCHCTFKRETDFYKCKFLGNANFDNSTFDRGVHFRKSLFDIGASFKKCVFGCDKANSSDGENTSIFNYVSFPETRLRSTVSFDGSVFHLPVRFVNDEKKNDEITLGNIQLTNCTFNNLVWIADRTFAGTLNLSGSEFNDVFQLENCKLQEIDQKNVDQIHNENWNIKLRNVEFKRLVVDGNQIKTAALENVNVKSFASFAKTKFDNLSVKNLSLEKGGDFSGMVVTTPLTRQTARLFKHAALSVNDRITANGFYALEMAAYEHEIVPSNSWLKRLLQWCSRCCCLHSWTDWIKSIFPPHFSERTILFLSKWSTNYGQSWWRGIWFTLIVGLIFYALMLLSLFCFGWIEFSWTCDGIGTFCRWFMEWFTWFPYVQSDQGFPNSLTDESPAWLPAILLGLNLIGKIFIVYGVYQTIQAFRKLRF